MQDSDCVRFLQWALPQLQMRWHGFRKVRKRVCKRLTHRLSELTVSNIEVYKHYLSQHPDEWRYLDTLCRIVVTRFYRDKRVYGELEQKILPQLASRLLKEGRSSLRIWSIGSASGEEPYSLAILWRHQLQPGFPQIQISILATEVDPYLIERSLSGCYTLGGIKNLPDELRNDAFTIADGIYCLKPHYRNMVEFRQQDIRYIMPDENFDLIFCRNLAFTYFDESLQKKILQGLLKRLLPGGWLILGVHEKLPVGLSELQTVSHWMGIYHRPIS